MIEIKFTGDDVCKLRAEMMAFCNVNTIPDLPSMIPKYLPVVEATPEPVKRGRKPKEVTVPEAPTNVAIQEPEPEPEPSVAQAPVVNVTLPTEKEVQDAVVAVNARLGIDKAIECLTKFGVKRARELTEDQRAGFIKHCNEVLK